MEPTNSLIESKTPQVVNHPITLKYSLHLGALNLKLPPAFNFSVLLFLLRSVILFLFSVFQQQSETYSWNAH